MADTAECHRTGDAAGGGFVAAVDGVEEVDAGPVGEAGDGDVGQCLGGAFHVQGAADGGVGFVEQGQALLGPVLLADVEGRGERTPDPTGRIPHR
ncbi:hypothetical protein FDG2_6134 [Candidatus Protofrankia californiensis]|uniref:Uncharacterized protein n=1 Tax=Candidatus Protofrankia californiensis TaxID=1839754 RepID=A0A1C3PGE1_9ACTN|nr:hypothetical protein FDG2_6134 [Candidatus Protofrankia californiensis]